MLSSHQFLDERIKYAERHTSNQSRRSETISVQNSSRSRTSSSSSSSNSSLEEGQEMELEIDPNNDFSSQDVYQMYKESVKEGSITKSRVSIKIKSEIGVKVIVKWKLQDIWFPFLILQNDNSGTKRRVSQRKNDKQKTANGTTHKTITEEIRTSYSERSELQSVLNIGTVGRLKLFSFIQSNASQTKFSDYLSIITMEWYLWFLIYNKTTSLKQVIFECSWKVCVKTVIYYLTTISLHFDFMKELQLHEFLDSWNNCHEYEILRKSSFDF